MNNLQQLKTKNKKICLVKRKKPPCNYQVPIINLSDFETDTTCLKYGLHHSLMDNNKFIKHDLGIEHEPLA